MRLRRFYKEIKELRTEIWKQAYARMVDKNLIKIRKEIKKLKENDT